MALSSKEILELTGATGTSSSREFTRVAGLDTAGEDAVVFATTAPVLEQARSSQAGLVLANLALKTADVDDAIVFWVRDARLAFAQVAQALEPARQPYIDPRATIADRVDIGHRVRIATGCVVGEGAVLGDDCILHPNVTLYPNVRLGARVVVHAGAVLGAAGFGYARSLETGGYVLFPQQGSVEIGDDVEIGANSTIDRGALGATRIGAGTKIDNLVHIGHNCVIGANVIIAAQTGISGSSVVEDGAILGGQVGIGEHATVGQGVILGGGAGVLSGKKMHGPGEVFWGRPARPLKEYLRDLARLKKR